MFNNKQYTIQKKTELEPKVIIVQTSNEDEKRNFQMTKLDANFKKPIEGSIQDNMTTTEMINSVKGYRKLSSIEDKIILKTLPLFKTRVKYYDTDKKLFRSGGVLTKVEYPTYIMLMNIVTKVGWSVQLNKNIIFIPEDSIENSSKGMDKKKEEMTKDKLYKLYQKGEIIRKKNC